MGYIKAIDVFPEALICEIQTYVDGELIYIPKLERGRWGTNTTTKSILEERNRNILEEYRQGASFSDLSKKYYLAEKSISRIIRQLHANE